MAYHSKTSNVCLICLKDCDRQKDHSISSSVTPDSLLVSGRDSAREGCSCHDEPSKLLGSPFLDLELRENKSFHHNIKYIFVLRKLLNYPSDKCVEYLEKRSSCREKKEGEDKEEDDGLFSVCDTCSVSVEEGHDIYHKIEALEARLNEIRKNFKETIVSSREQKDKQRNETNEREDAIYSEFQDYFFSGEGHREGSGLRSPIEKDEYSSSEEQSEDGEDDDYNDEGHEDDEIAERPDFDSDWAPSCDENEGEALEQEDVKPDVAELLLQSDSMQVESDQFLRRSSRKRPRKPLRRRSETSSDDDYQEKDKESEETNSKSEDDRPLRKETSKDGGGPCSVCGVRYLTKHRLKEHENLHFNSEGIKLFKCRQCPFVCKTNKGLLVHLCRFHRRKGDPSRTSMKKKVKRGDDSDGEGLQSEFVCSVCNVVYQTAHRLKEHEDLHSRDDVLRCTLCNFVCLVERGMKIHVTKYHKTKEEIVEEKVKKKRGRPKKETLVEVETETNEDFSKRYSCEICDAAYEKRSRAIEHKLLHQDPNAVKCPRCSFVCLTQRHLKSHILRIHELVPPRKTYDRGGPFHCLTCPAVYKSYHRFKQHCDLHDDETSFACQECGWVFESEHQRDRHLRGSHQSKQGPTPYRRKRDDVPFTCEECSAVYKNRYRFKEHFQTYHKDKMLECESCKRSFEGPRILEIHKPFCRGPPREDSVDRNVSTNMDPDVPRFPCTNCSAVFRREMQLRHHLSRAHPKIHNVCKVCGYKSHGPSQLRLHMQKHTKEKMYMCEICSKTFVSPTYLQAHKTKVHYEELGVTPIKCDLCDLILPSQSILKYHIKKVHEKDFKFFCETCGKGFLFISMLRNHVITHSSERNEVCQICGASYVHNRVLMSHMKAHHPEQYAAARGIDPPPNTSGLSNEGPFICKFCNKEFAMRWSLHSHMKTHTEIYDKYKCDICGKGYSSQAGVKRHEETAHLSATFSCEGCGKVFSCRDYLRYHRKNHCRKGKEQKVDVRGDGLGDESNDGSGDNTTLVSGQPIQINFHPVAN